MRLMSRPKARPFASTEELLEILGLSRRTLYEYVQLGILPAPRRMSDGNGVHSRWPRSAIDHARMFVAQRETGYALDEIRAMLHERFGSADKVSIEDAKAYEEKVLQARQARAKARKAKKEKPDSS